MKKNDSDGSHVQYCSSNSVLVINPAGKLKQVFVPFPVYSLEFKEGKRGVFIVEEVRSTAEDRLVYMINGRAYFHYLFYLEISF